MINVEAEVNKHKNCKDRDELGRQIKNYKNLAIQSAANLVAAGQYTMIVKKLQEIYDKLPAPSIKLPTCNKPNTPVKTAAITSEEKARINDAWSKKTKN